jgi:integrase
MARSIRSATLETRTARLKLPVTSRPVYVKIGAGLGLGYRRNATSGTWVARIADGRGSNIRKTIGTADDFAEANGRDVLDYWQASDAARRLASGNAGPAVVTLGDALDRYEADLRTRDRDVVNVTRIRRHLSEAMTKKPVALISTTELRRWRDGLAAKIAPASVNRTCRGLKAALNLCADQDDSLSRHAWRTGLALIGGAEQSNNVILSETVIKDVVAAARDESVEFGLFVEVAAQTGARPSQIRRIQVQDLIGAGEATRLSIPVSRKGRGVKAVTHRAAPIGAPLAARLKVVAGGRAVTEPLLLKPSGAPWEHSDQKKPFRRVAAAAGQDPSKVTMYALRHSSITRMLLAGVPVRVVADHHDTGIEMIERTYSRHIGQHTDAMIRDALIDTEVADSDVVVPLHRPA